MLAKLRAQEIQAFSKYKSADGTDGVTNSTGGLTFKNGLYVGGTVSATSTSISPDSITIMGTGGLGYVAFSAQTSAPAISSAHLYADTSGRLAIGHSGSTAYNAILDNGALTAHRIYNLPNRSAAIALSGDNVSQFVNDAGYLTTTSANLLYVPLGRTITEGAGLAGNTYDLSANRTLAMGTPSGLSVSSSNSVSGTTHSHAITSSSNPGAAAAILATDASGYVRLVRLGIGTAPTQPLEVAGNVFINSATANLYLKDTSTGFRVGTTGIVALQSANAFQSTSYTSGLVGYNISADGNAEFNNVRVRGELAASVFKVNEIAATAGTLGVFYSATTLVTDLNTGTSIGDSSFFIAKRSDTGGALLAVGDYIRLKSFTGSGISDSWLVVTIVDNTTYPTGTSYLAELVAGSTSAGFKAGTAVVDYGPSGTGFITLSADGTVGSTPNLTMATHSGSPWSSFTPLLRLGNLNGSYGYVTNAYGLGIGQYGASQAWMTFDTTNGIRLGNNTTTLIQLDTSGNAIFGQVATNKANVYWNASNQRLEFRGSTSGTVVQSYIDTDGAFVSGGGDVKISSTGIVLVPGISGGLYQAKDSVRWVSGSTTVGEVYSLYSAGVSASTFVDAIAVSGDTSGAISTLSATGTNGTNAYVKVITNTGGTSTYAAIRSSLGVQIASSFGLGVTPAHMLDVYGTGWFQGALTPDGGIVHSTALIGTTTYTWLASTPVVHFNGAVNHTVTLLAPASYVGMIIYVHTYTAQTVTSASANVVDLAGTVTTSILAATVGKWAQLQSDGTYWRMIAAN